MKMMMKFARRMISLEASYLLQKLCCAWLFCSLLTVRLNGQSNQMPFQTHLPKTNSKPITLQSFWEHTPVIAKMHYSIIFPPNEYNPKGSQGEIQEELLLTMDGTNALLCPVNEAGQMDGLCTGRYQSVFWHYYSRKHVLALADSKINKIEPLPKSDSDKPETGHAGPVGEGERYIFQRRLDNIINLGLPEIDRSAGIIWDANDHELKGALSEEVAPHNKGVPLVLEFHYESGLPRSSILRAIMGGKVVDTGISEIYDYNSNFFDGQFPFQITRFAPKPPEVSSNVPDYTIRIQELLLSDNPISEAELNPVQLFEQVKNLTLVVWSNNIRYAVSRAGWNQILSAEENDAQLLAKRNQNHPHSITLVRTLLITFALGSLIFIAWSIIGHLRNAKHKQNTD